MSRNIMVRVSDWAVIERIGRMVGVEKIIIPSEQPTNTPATEGNGSVRRHHRGHRGINKNSKTFIFAKELFTCYKVGDQFHFKDEEVLVAAATAGLVTGSISSLISNFVSQGRLKAMGFNSGRYEVINTDYENLGVLRRGH